MRADTSAGRRSILVLLVLALAGLLGLATAAWAGAYRLLREADYPGALQLSHDTGFRLSPVLRLSRSTSYQTMDSFSEVYIWYSTRFGLGPEKYALGSCNQMLRSAAAFVIFESQMSVAVCDTPDGRRMWVDRSLTLDWR